MREVSLPSAERPIATTTTASHTATRTTSALRVQRCTTQFNPWPQFFHLFPNARFFFSFIHIFFVFFFFFTSPDLKVLNVRNWSQSSQSSNF